jgi:toxin ParE1/3/4
MSVIRRHPSARRDLVDIFYRYAREGSLGTARRFLSQAEATFQRLASQPGIGARFDPENAHLATLRFFPVSRFKKYLVFYRPAPGGIEILRVLHGARDLQGILTDDLDVADVDDEGALPEEDGG